MSSKRKATTPIQNREKETRLESNMSDVNNIPTEGQHNSELTFQSQDSRRGSVASRESFLTVASKTTQRTEKPIRESVFVTSKPEGALRDEIVVEFLTFDDKPFKGSITIKEARRKIFQEILGFNQTDLSALKLTYSGGPIAIFKLVAPFDIDQLESIEFFDWKRTYDVRGEEKSGIMKCKIRGIRKTQRGDKNYVDTGIRWVKIEGNDWRIEKGKMLEWLSYFGEIRSDLTEDVHEGSEDSEDDLQPVGLGVYSVKMKLRRDIPQFIPMDGRRIRIYYRTIVKRCTNCFQQHLRKQCKNEKVEWFSYVKRFSELHPEIPANFYGRCSSMIESRPPTETESQETESQETEEQTRAESNEETQTTKSVPKGTKPRIQKVAKRMKEKTKQKTNDANESYETEEEEVTQTEEEKINELVRKMLASGVSSGTLEKRLSTDEKTKGAGRGRGRGAGKIKK